MIEELALQATTQGNLDGHVADPSALIRGLLVAVGLSVPVWGGLVWSLTKVT